MVDARISSWTTDLPSLHGRRRFLGAAGSHAGVVGSSFATENSSAELAPILRHLWRLRWPRACPFDRRNLRVVPPTFRSGGPSQPRPFPFAATIGVVASTLQLVSDGATHVGVASDHVIESFRNDMWAGYKTSAGMDPELLAQIPLMEEALGQRRVHHVGDGRVRGRRCPRCCRSRRRRRPARHAGDDRHARQGPRSVRARHPSRAVRPAQGRDRRRGGRDRQVRGRAGVDRRLLGARGRLGRRLSRASPGWGAKSAATVLAKFGSITEIPASSGDWGLPALRGAEKLAVTLRDNFELALLFRRIATIEVDVPVGTVDDWQWKGPTKGFAATRRPARRAAPGRAAPSALPSELTPAE